MMKSIALFTTLLSLPLIAADTALTIYNQNFAVVRDRVPLKLSQGVNDISYPGATLHLEPDSVILRDRTGKTRLQILEQSYRGDVLSQGLLLNVFQGKTIPFLVRHRDGSESIIDGRIVRSGYTPNMASAIRYGNQFRQTQMHMGAANTGGSPIIEIDGRLRFSLPGEPLFPSLGDDTILKPTLSWKLHSSRTAELDAELSYLTGGMSWEAAYNLVLPEMGSTMDVVGWVTLDNQSGKRFDEAAIKLMAGDVSKLQPDQSVGRMMRESAYDPFATAPEVTEKAFDEFHLYTLPGKFTLRNRETKQVEFLRATGVKAETVYVYNGADIDWRRHRGWNDDSFRNNRDFGANSNPKVWVMREFENSEENGLGIPLPAGKTRFYRQDDADGRPEFTGENRIDHTPRNERVSVYTGDSFDLVGERKQADYQIDSRRRELSEAFEITLRNRKEQAVEIRVAERLYRGVNWEIVEKSDDFTMVDARNIEFRVKLKPDEERKVTYRVRYTW